MYRHCIYCSADLGANDVLEAFPVGRTVAFDAAKGRLWAVCAKCARWNLAPLEERWETVEDAERRFVDARLRVQRESIGLAKARDGTRLVRIGPALPNELAAWRYAGQLIHRRTTFYLASVASGVALATLYSAATATGLLGAGILVYAGALVLTRARTTRPAVRIPGPDGDLRVLRWCDLDGLRLGRARGEVEVTVPEAAGADEGAPLVVRGDAASVLLTRAMVRANQAGASRRGVDEALDLLAEAGGALGYLDYLSRCGVQVSPAPFPWSRGRRRPGAREAPPTLQGATRIALEMALHDEAERRALHGELKLLESAWREAETLAAIADRLAAPALPGEPMATGG